MNKELLALYITAASIGFLHTVFGPDHYLPFIVMSRARQWSLAKTALITFLCGLGHIMSSVVLGIIGIIFGIAVMKLEALEAFRGNLAGWALISFGFTYFVWGLHRAWKNRPHRHLHTHPDFILSRPENRAFQGADNKWPLKYSATETSGFRPRSFIEHQHTHIHTEGHVHIHEEAKKNITPWVLFTIFVFGPCEPLIPILMYPAVKHSLSGLVGVSAIFGAVTIVTMLVIVMIAYLGINVVPLGRLERYSHALAGATICLCGLAIQFLGL